MVKGKKTRYKNKEHCWLKAELDKTSQGHQLPIKLLLLKQVKTLKRLWNTKKLLTTAALAQRKEKSNFSNSTKMHCSVKDNITGPKWSCLY